MDAPRFLRITSPLGEGALIATRLTVTERLGMPYSIEVDVLGSNPNLKPRDLLTKEITVTVAYDGDNETVTRHFHGLVAEFQRTGSGAARRMGYRLVAVPGIWRLGLKSNCRIFQEKTVKQIVETILSEHEQPAPNWGILPAMEPIPYCTQFNETDLHFVSRLLEEYGMSYYFTHEASAHKLCISATAPGFPTFSGGDLEARHDTKLLHELSGWRRRNRARSAKTKFEDMDVERSQPSTVIKKNSDTRVYADEPSMWSAGESYRWPGGMSTRKGLDSAAVAMGEQEFDFEEFDADTRDPRLLPGARMFVSVQLEDGGSDRQQYVVTSARHEAADRSGLIAGAGETETYHGTISLVAANRTWMQPQIHLRPVLAGLYSAKVTGPSGEKIYVDEFGRIKVKFRWDRLGKDDDTSSCWVRVMQSAAGSWGGTWFLPRVGDEVLVAFLDGDPDRPVVAGSVYGKDAKPPFQPGSNRAQSGISTRSYKSESADDANILRFEDKKGSEEVFLHSQKTSRSRPSTMRRARPGMTTPRRSRTRASRRSRTSNHTLTLDKGDISDQVQPRPDHDRSNAEDHAQGGSKHPRARPVRASP